MWARGRDRGGNRSRQERREGDDNARAWDGGGGVGWWAPSTVTMRSSGRRQEEDEGAVRRGAEFCREKKGVVFAKTTFRHLICDGGSTKFVSSAGHRSLVGQEGARPLLKRSCNKVIKTSCFVLIWKQTRDIFDVDLLKPPCAAMHTNLLGVIDMGTFRFRERSRKAYCLLY
jgi:hypothetical protein